MASAAAPQAQRLSLFWTFATPGKTVDVAAAAAALATLAPPAPAPAAASAPRVNMPPTSPANFTALATGGASAGPEVVTGEAAPALASAAATPAPTRRCVAAAAAPPLRKRPHAASPPPPTPPPTKRVSRPSAKAREANT